MVGGKSMTIMCVCVRVCVCVDICSVGSHSNAGKKKILRAFVGEWPGVRECVCGEGGGSLGSRRKKKGGGGDVGPAKQVSRVISM